MESANIAHELKCAKDISTVIRTYIKLYIHTHRTMHRTDRSTGRKLCGEGVHLSSLGQCATRPRWRHCTCRSRAHPARVILIARDMHMADA
jgi:hypothetical protein